VIIPYRGLIARGEEGHPMFVTETISRRLAARTWHARLPRLDGFALALVGVVVAATLLPCDGRGARLFNDLGILGIGSLFFLQGARLSRDAIVSGLTHWRLHLATASTTFLIFPVVGLGMRMLFPMALPPLAWMGVLFACVLPSTVQSSIALTSIAKGNVPAAICSATLSNVAGIFITPLLFALTSRLHGGVIDTQGVWNIFSRLLVPFVAGHCLRPWIGAWAARNRAVLSVTDRGSILVVVYTAFSAAVVHGIWHQLPPETLAVLCCVMALMLACGFVITTAISRVMATGIEDESAVVFCGSQKSLITGVPMANALFGAATVGPLLLPIMIYYPMQLLFGAWLARRYASVGAVRTGTPPTNLPVSVRVVVGRDM
jgi:solute carrier family 10 (sodium/bile acid cotransporter), member 7